MKVGFPISLLAFPINKGCHPFPIGDDGSHLPSDWRWRRPAWGRGRSTIKFDSGGARGAAKLGRGRDCQLMGLTWLLARNRTLYMRTVTRVLCALMMTLDGSEPLSCTLSRDGMPLAVDSVQLEDPTTSSSSATPSPSQRLSVLRRMLHFVCIFWL
ncbi:hypothetical protein Taro_033025 [Colocasia esculenta]|uniref:Uncharacterized protein n=1 Tax=Colocasia esculenta TaxID=4460 RepID=A0A843VMS4_COLES|nr:hypothetical protein [Colocasia esculenta]